ncbi:MAG: hypothetical protein JO255_00780, partial [Alphaproteobacteria bacterium]|nr:hypothetical protein [Alphaproteobacteria bacterium]
PAFLRLNETVSSQIVSYRKGAVVAIHDKKHQTVENCIVPLARDGVTVDILVACSVLYTLDGNEN